MANNTEQKYSTKSILIGISMVVSFIVGTVLYQDYKSVNEKEENDKAKVTLSLDLHTIAEKLAKDSTFLNPYFNTYIETDGTILDFTKYDQGSGICIGIIGIHKTDSALFVDYPLDYDSLLLKKDLTECDQQKLLYRRADKRRQASNFIYSQVEFTDKVIKDIKPVIYNPSCGVYYCSKYRKCYQLEYFTNEHLKIKGLLKKMYKDDQSIYQLSIENAVIISREKLLE